MERCQVRRDFRMDVTLRRVVPFVWKYALMGRYRSTIPPTVQRSAAFSMMRKKPFRISGRKVLLRSPKISALAEFTAWAKKSERFHRGLMRFAKTKAEFEGFLERAEGPSSEVLLICEVGSGAIAGMINLSQIFYGPLKSAYMGYGLGVDYTGKGFATEAVELMT